ncbi:primary-amine oxidase [Pseudonocardia sp. TRM90224]|uniref:primary-amine oxidase n=1 Tax=Pseudonocardia sp. TRM90224 TaxID=2812678 RepID=UPI001E5A2DA9|nr:primary-amine oxidase [Pseudonocardia sp. TRM90224]
MTAVEDPVTTTHPLDPLSAHEITAAAAVLREAKQLEPSTRFVFVALHEPPKEQVLAGGAALPRQAHVVAYDRAAKATYEAVVDIGARTVVSWARVDGVQPPMMLEEFMSCEALVQADPRWQEAMRRRGVEDFSLTMVDPWASSWTGPEDDPSRRRLARPLTFVRAEPGENGYARPVEGLIVEVDLDAGEVVDVIDHGVVPLPTEPGNYAPPWAQERRDGVRPIEITQPEGPSFTVDGHAVRWQSWELRIGFTPREGLVLHQVAYAGRPVLYRASLAEMYVPYGDPAPTHRFKNVFDQGEYGVGWLANPLTLGCDCVGHIHYFDGVVNDNDGGAVTIPNAVCMHEEDAGIGWKHTDFRTGAVEVRRRRRLVISTIVTVGNYEYGYFWHLHTDGTIEYEVKLTGIISTGAVAPGMEPEHGTLVAPGLYGPNHQHFFCVRLDMSVDGTENTVVEVDSAPSPAGPDNPHGNAWRTHRTVLVSEAVAQRDTDVRRARYWSIESATRTSALGRPTAYALMPGASVPPMYAPEALFARRAGFTDHQLWVTAHDPAQRFAAGDYPNQSPGGDGLPAYVTGDRPLEGADVVVWYTFGAHHVVRPEDWPVMPVSTVGFTLRPHGFFDRNPALDMPPGETDCTTG